MHLAGTDVEVPAALVQPEDPATDSPAAGVAGGSFAASMSDLSHATAHAPSVIEGAGNDQASVTSLPDPKPASDIAVNANSPAAATPAPEQAPSKAHPDHATATAEPLSALVKGSPQPPALHAVQTGGAEGSSHGSDSRGQLSPKSNKDDIKVRQLCAVFQPAMMLPWLIWLSSVSDMICCALAPSHGKSACRHKHASEKQVAAANSGVPSGPRPCRTRAS